MKLLNQIIFALLATFAIRCGVLISAANAQTFTAIKSFGILTNFAGATPLCQLVQGADGTLYGTASSGEGNIAGSAGKMAGTIFTLQPDGGGFAVLRYFTNWTGGANPHGTLTLSGAVLYGTTSGGGSSDYGTVFKLNTD